MDHWMQMKDDNTAQSAEIQMKCCPRCKTIIRTCLRYGDVLKSNYEDIVLVKKKLQSSIESSQAFSEQTNSKLAAVIRSVADVGDVAASGGGVFTNVLQATIEDVRKKIERRQRRNGNWIYSSLDADDRHLIQVKVEVMDRILEVLKEAQQTKNDPVRRTPMKPELLADLFARSVKLLSSVNDRRRMTDAEYQAFADEITRFSFIRVYYTLKSSSNFTNHSLIADEKAGIEAVLTKNVKKLADTDKGRMKELMTKMGNKLQTGLGIDEKERQDIVKAMGLTQGHWFKCPNGHLYVIGECGGARQASYCNECRAPIGGEGYALRSGNQHDGRMDGSLRGAYPNREFGRGVI